MIGAAPGIAEKAARSRRFIQDDGVVRYHLLMGLALLERGMPEAALEHLTISPADTAPPAMTTIATCEALRRCGRTTEAETRQAALGLNDPQTELDARIELAAFCADHLVGPALTESLIDAASALARSAGKPEAVRLADLERLAYRQATGSPTTQAMIAEACLTLVPASGVVGVRGLSLVASFLTDGPVNGLDRATLDAVWRRFIDLAGPVAARDRPDVVMPDWQRNALFGDADGNERLMAFARSVLAVSASWPAGLALVAGLARRVGDQQSDYESAAALWRGVVALAPDAVEARARGALSLIGIGAPPSQVTALLPPGSWLSQNLGVSDIVVRALTAVGQGARAVTLGREATAAFPGNSAKRLSLALALLATGDDAEASSLLRTIDAPPPELASTHAVLLAAAALAEGHDLDAAAALDRAAAGPAATDPVVGLWRGVLLTRAGEGLRGAKLIDGARAALGDARIRIHLHTMPRTVAVVGEALGAIRPLAPAPLGG